MDHHKKNLWVPSETTRGHWVEQPADPRCERSLQLTHMHCANLQRSPIAFSTRPDFLMSPPPARHISLSPPFRCRHTLERKCNQCWLLTDFSSWESNFFFMVAVRFIWDNSFSGQLSLIPCAFLMRDILFTCEEWETSAKTPLICAQLQYWQPEWDTFDSSGIFYTLKLFTLWTLWTIWSNFLILDTFLISYVSKGIGN